MLIFIRKLHCFITIFVQSAKTISYKMHSTYIKKMLEYLKVGYDYFLVYIYVGCVYLEVWVTLYE